MNKASVIELCPSEPDRIAKYFTELFVSETFAIPEQKPDLKQLVLVNRTITIEDAQTVEVDVPAPGTDGNKIFVSGNIYLSMQYVADKAEQTVHYARFQLPFQTIILADCGELIPPDDTIFGPDNSYVVHVCVEKVETMPIDKRNVFFKLLLLVWVEEVETP